MRNFEVARQFDLMADLLEIRGENPFRIRAYRRAALNLKGLIEDVETARQGIPAGVVELMGVPGIGPKTARLLYEKEGVTSLARLEALARAGRLRGLPGVQAKTEANILAG